MKKSARGPQVVVVVIGGEANLKHGPYHRHSDEIDDMIKALKESGARYRIDNYHPGRPEGKNTPTKRRSGRRR